MKTLRLSLLVSALVFVPHAAFADAPAVKTDIPTSKSGFSFVTVDLVQLMDPNTSKATEFAEEYKAIITEFEKAQEKIQQELPKLQAKVEEEYKKLDEKQKKGEQPSKEETAKLESMFRELQMKNGEPQERAKMQSAKLQADFKAKIDAAIKVVADKKGYENVFFKEVVLYSKNQVDITADVIAELNTKYAAEKRAKKMAAETAKPATKTAKAA